ncbi:type II toxin-antitoxin system VapC family toxin [Corticibacterium sp. UT-5YL-CI-8]|nr:type II toxin-antitoxin system VapC family toxin [Tianweitania sp. UT-5YL-CI-8]
MTLVVDASITLAWILEDERNPTHIALFERVGKQGAFVPQLWRLEVANGLRSALRRGRITLVFRDESLADLQALDLATDSETNDNAWSTIIALSDAHNLTPYDAAYLELAQRRRLPLATLNSRLAQAARSIGVEVRGLD